MGTTAIIACVIIALLVVAGIGALFMRLYHRATRERSFVRTGLGGKKIVMDGGAIVLPIFHEFIDVNMNTLKLEVIRTEANSLSTKDRMRIDVTATFFVRVKQNADAVSIAAQTLGQRTKDPAALKSLVEDKFVDALRSAAVTMTMKELQDQRKDFIKAVQGAVNEDLEKNGLELESVSLTRLDQTDKKHFNPDNAFDAEGLTLLTRETQTRRKERNEIEQDTSVAVEKKNLEATQRTLELRKEREFATRQQEREVANQAAEQKALIQQTEAKRSQEGQEAQIEADRAVKQSQIAASQAVRAAEIARDLELRNQQTTADAEAEVRLADQRRRTEIANQETKIAVANKSREQSEADAQANEARAVASKAEQNVITVTMVAEAERAKSISLIEAARAAEQLAIGVTTQATAEKNAAANKAEAITIVADAERHAALAKAAGIEAMTEARNRLGAPIIDMDIQLERLRNLPAIIAAAVKPAERIDSLRVVQINGGVPGMNGQPGAAGGGAGATTTPSLPDDIANAILKVKSAGPVVDTLIQAAGFDGADLQGLLGPAMSRVTHAVAPTESSEASSTATPETSAA
jgi:uncharacterized membrane protein YqiK